MKELIIHQVSATIIIIALMVWVWVFTRSVEGIIFLLVVIGILFYAFRSPKNKHSLFF